MNKTPLIFEIKPNSLDDGPGIRTVVFFKGCPLSCVWCHNPEGRSADLEIAFEAGKCIACDSCLGVCPEDALARSNPFYIDRLRCTLCSECLKACPSGALTEIGREYSVVEIVETVARDRPFFADSGGGVTLSGGEPTMFVGFSAKLAEALRDKGIPVLLETCGLFNFDSFAKLLYPHLDLIYFDLKIIDEQAHRRYCGASNETILRNLVSLSRLKGEGGIDFLPRIPLVPGLTDGEENLAAIAGFLRSNDIRRVALLPYNPLWGPKSAKVGRGAPAIEGAELGRWMPDEELARCRSYFADFELS